MRAMTGYAHIVKRKKSQTLQLILRSTNYKYLDIVLYNLPVKQIFLEEKIKRVVRQSISRGKIEIHIVYPQSGQGKLIFQEKVLTQYISQIKKIANKHQVDPHLGIRDILSLPHVFAWEEKAQDNSLLLSALKSGVLSLVDFKKKEGQAIKKAMLRNVNHLRNNITKLLTKKPLRIKGEQNNKQDIDEEISLISFYVNKLATVINSRKSSHLGKSIDFLTQEILRELNAASSKTRNKTLGVLIVESKSYLERIREQAQNVE